MKNLSLFLLSLCASFSLSAQCTLTGLNSFYCSSDTGSQLSASCTGGSPTISGPGVNGLGYFNPANAGTDSVAITVIGGDLYSISQSGNFLPQSTTGDTLVSLSDDAVSSELPIGFDFNFFENNYDEFYISSNGFIGFANGMPNGCCSGQSLPNSGMPNNIIAFAWEDLNPAYGGTIGYRTIGTSPNKQLLVTFSSIQHYGGGYPVTAQVKLFEGCGLIEIHTTSMPSDGGSHTMGIENSNGSTAFPVSGRNASSWTISSDFVAFEPNCGDTFWTVVSDGPDLALTEDSLNVCFGDSNSTATVTATGVSPFSYEWSTGSTSSTAASLGGLVNVSVTVTDDDGCSSEGDLFIYSPQPIQAGFTSVNSSCANTDDGSITLSASGGVAPYSYLWSNGVTTAANAGISAGSYVVTITDANDCEIALTENLGFDNATPSVDLGADLQICPGQTKALIAPPGFALYEWSDGSTSNSLFINQPGTYSVTVTSTAGCIGSDEITVVEVLPDYVDLGPNVTDYAPITLDAGSQYTNYQWSTGSSNQTISVVFAGEYSVVVVDSNTCPSGDTINVKIIPVGIDERSSGELLVYPNPSKDLVQLSYNGVATDVVVSLFDSHGSLVYRSVHDFKVGELELLDLSTLARGAYSLKLEGETLVKEKAIILQ